MDKKETALQALLSQKVLPLYYHDSAGVSLKILQALYKAGVRTVEYTNRGEHALENFKHLRKAVNEAMQGLQLGIGTIKNKPAAEAFITAGADFLVCPSVNAEVGKAVLEAGLLWVPGCMTATEIATAENSGAEVIKLFPGSLFGPSYIPAVKDIFPSLKFVVTGGVEAEEKNLREWFKAGVVGVGLGSKMISKELLAKEDYDGLQEIAKKILTMVKSIG